MQELKERQFSEHKRLMDIIDAERQSIQSERVKIETMARLKPVLQQTQPQGDRSEIDAAVKIAQDVARQTGAEREKLVALQHQCELERQELVNMKNTVRNKEHELERQIRESAEQTVSTITIVQPLVVQFSSPFECSLKPNMQRNHVKRLRRNCWKNCRICNTVTHSSRNAK